MWSYGTGVVGHEAPTPRKAILEIDDLAIPCIVAEIPAVGDVVFGDVSAIVETIKITRTGRVHISARRVEAASQSVRLDARSLPEPVSGRSDRVEAILTEMRRRRRDCRAQSESLALERPPERA